MTKNLAKLCAFFVLSFFLPLLGLFGSPSAIAQSPYDDYIKTTNSLKLFTKYRDKSCELDITHNYTSFITDKNIPYHTSLTDSFIDKYKETLSIGGDWAITQSRTYDKNYDYTQQSVTIFFTLTDFSLDWNSNSLNLATDGSIYYHANINIDEHCNVRVTGGPWGGGILTYNPNHETYKPPYYQYWQFINIKNPNYPEGYSGIKPPSTYTPVTPLNIKFDYNVANKDVTLKFYDINPDLDYIHGYDIRRTGDIGCGKGDIPICKPPHEAKQFKDGSAGKDGEVKFTVPKYGYYIIGVALWPPDIPPDKANSDNIIKGSTMLWVDLKIDGSYFNGTATNQDETGDLYNCETDTLDGTETTRCNASVQKPCEVTGLTDLFPFISCVMANFFNSTKSLSFQLIIPDWSNVSTQFNKTMTSIKISLGFLWAPIDFIIQAFKLVIGQTNNPTGNTCNIGNISVFGSASSGLHLCAWRYQFPQLWQYMQIFIQGGIAFGFTLAFWRKFMSIFGHEVGEYLDDDAGFTQGENFGSNRTYVKGDSPAGFREMMPKGDPDKKYRR